MIQYSSPTQLLSPIFSSPTVSPVIGDSTYIWIGSHAKKLFCINSLSGTITYSVPLSSEMLAKPTLVGDGLNFIAAASTDGSILLVSFESMEVVASINLDVSIYSSPAAAAAGDAGGSEIVVGTRGNYTVVINYLRR